MKRKIRTLSGTTNPQITEREIENRKIARKSAAEGIVLMKNDGVLPLEKNSSVALFGIGAAHTIKGGTGSGDVNEREVVSIYQGMLNAGFDIVNKEWVEDAKVQYDQSRIAWRDKILAEVAANEALKFFEVYANNAYQTPEGMPIEASMFNGAVTSIYVISRVAGEGADRFDKAGDYYLTEREKEDLQILSENSLQVIVIINAGGQMDLKDILSVKNVKAILNISQPGMEGGNAVADVLCGAVTPSGKLTHTWAKNYEDFPNAETFSHNNGNVETEFYEESIYVGYRYFDSFGVEVEYPFGMDFPIPVLISVKE